MASKKVTKRKFKNHFDRIIRDRIRRYKYVWLVVQEDLYKISTQMIVVFHQKDSSRRRNQMIDSSINYLWNLRNTVVAGRKCNMSVYAGASDEYPLKEVSISGIRTIDLRHNVLRSIVDMSGSKLIKSGDLAGKHFARAFYDYQAMYGETQPVSIHEFHAIVKSLHRNRLVVFTRFGSLWYKDYFIKKSKENDLNWRDLVIDFNKAALKGLI